MKQRQNVTALAYDKRGRLLSVGKNSYVKTHPMQAKFAAKASDPSRIYLHAEIAALIKARGKVHRLVITRIGRSGKPILAKPCDCCQKAIEYFQVKVIEHT